MSGSTERRLLRELAPRLDAAIKVGKDSSDDVGRAAQTSAEAVKDAVDDAVGDPSENGRGGA